MADLNVEQIVRLLNLQPLPVEGGLYAQTYRSKDEIPSAGLPERYQAAGEELKPFGTAILYLLTNEPAGNAGEFAVDNTTAFSALHRLRTDEIFHFYLGDPLEMTLLLPDGSIRQVLLGQDLLAGQQIQFTVPHGVWQGTRLLPGGRFALVGTTMAPGFTDPDYEHGSRADLLAQYPGEQERILALTR
jgi:uncharacterized protein